MVNGTDTYSVRLNGDGTVTIPSEVYSTLCSNSDLLGMMKEFFGLEHWEHYEESVLFYNSQKDS